MTGDGQPERRPPGAHGWGWRKRTSRSADGMTERRTVVALWLAARGPQTVAQVVEGTGIPDIPVRRILLQPWFERVGEGRPHRYRLSPEGRAAVNPPDAPPARAKLGEKG